MDLWRSASFHRPLYYAVEALNKDRDDASSSSASDPEVEALGREREAPHEVPSREHASINNEILAIALPMLLTLSADPIAGLADTYFLSKLGSNAVAGTGIALSIYNLLSKPTNVPVLSVATTNVAAAFGRWKSASNLASDPSQVEEASDALQSAAASCIALGLYCGTAQAVILSQSLHSILPIWGIDQSSQLLQPTLDFLLVRILGAPVTSLLLTLQGVFRGLADATTPLYASIASNAINLAFAPTLIFVCGWGVKGAALATVLSQMVPCCFLMVQLSLRLNTLAPSQERSFTASLVSAAASPTIFALFKPTGLLILRTVAVTLTYAAATSAASNAGALPAAAHAICFQVWMASSLLADALAIAAQTLLASSLAAGEFLRARIIALRSVTLSLGLGAVLSVLLLIGKDAIAGAFSSNVAVLSLCAFLMPIVAFSQPLNALAFTLDGVVYGSGGFVYACVFSACAALPALALILKASWVAGSVGDKAMISLGWTWGGLCLLMALRGAFALAALVKGWGPFKAMGPQLTS
jgi:putative MATE family efflux protein